MNGNERERVGQRGWERERERERERGGGVMAWGRGGRRGGGARGERRGLGGSGRSRYKRVKAKEYSSNSDKDVDSN